MPRLTSQNFPTQIARIEVSTGTQHTTANSIQPLLQSPPPRSNEPWFTPFITSNNNQASALQRIQHIILTPGATSYEELRQWVREPNFRQTLLPGICVMAILGGTLGFAQSANAAEHAGQSSPQFSTALLSASMGAVLAPVSFTLLAIGMRALLAFSTAVSEEAANGTTSRRQFVQQITDHWQDLPASTTCIPEDESCPITFLPLYDEDENQRIQEPMMINQQAGIFEYRELLTWFIKNPTNPLTREAVDPAALRKVVRPVETQPTAHEFQVEGSRFERLDSIV